jgi:conjugal transfer pilus assembly protein TraU
MILFLLPLLAHAEILNPVTDICWSCALPIYSAGTNVTPSTKDYINHKKTFCSPREGILGIPISYFEPKKVIEVSTKPFHLVAFGGKALSRPTAKKRGHRYAYHAHYWTYPVMQLLNLAEHYACSSGGELSMGYMSEFDPFWFDDQWNAILVPEALLFSNLLAQAACIPDCMLTTLHKPQDLLFWCSGCQGSYWPMNGFVNHVRGPVQASSLIVHRLLGKLHRWGTDKTFEKDNYLEKTYSAYPRKTAYKLQLALPIKQTVKKCPPLGASEHDWGFMKSYPHRGESFAYIIWERSHCCLDPVEIAKKVATGGAK